MKVEKLVPDYVPLVKPMIVPDNQKDSSLLVSTPEEIQRQLKAWREEGQRLHIVV